MFSGHNPSLVALSIAIAILGGYTGFGLAARVRVAPGGRRRPLLAGAAAQGTGQPRQDCRAEGAPEVASVDAQRALDRLSMMAQGAGGGTRIGESLANFNRRHAARIIHSRTCVMIVRTVARQATPPISAAR